MKGKNEREKTEKSEIYRRNWHVYVFLIMQGN